MLPAGYMYVLQQICAFQMRSLRFLEEISSFPRGDLCCPQEISASEQRSVLLEELSAAETRSLPHSRCDLCFPEEISASGQRSHAAQSRSVPPRGDLCLRAEITCSPEQICASQRRYLLLLAQNTCIPKQNRAVFWKTAVLFVGNRRTFRLSHRLLAG